MSWYREPENTTMPLGERIETILGIDVYSSSCGTKHSGIQKEADDYLHTKVE